MRVCLIKSYAFAQKVRYKMYANLLKEMAVNGVTIETLASILDIHRNSVSYKLKKGSFSIEQAMRIRDKQFKSLDMQYLFKKSAEKEEKSKTCRC